MEAIVCACGSLEHLLVVSAEDIDYVVVSVHLSPKPFWQRLVGALKHIFGYRSKYGDFEEIILDAEKAHHLGESLSKWAQKSTVFSTLQKAPDALS